MNVLLSIQIGVTTMLRDRAFSCLGDLRAREVWNRVMGDLTDGASIFGRQEGVFRVRNFRSEDLRHSLQDFASNGRLQVGEDVAVDHVGQRISEQSSRQVEIAQRPPLLVSRAALRKGSGEG